LSNNPQLTLPSTTTTPFSREQLSANCISIPLLQSP
jgi:hypothetical protein